MPAVLAFLGTWEVIVILVVALLLFGTRLPKVARSAGESLSEFKKGMNEVKDEVEKAASDQDEKKKS